MRTNGRTRRSERNPSEQYPAEKHLSRTHKSDWASLPRTQRLWTTDPYCKSNELLGKSDEDVYTNLHACYDLRNKYSHAKFSQILDEKEKQSKGGREERARSKFSPIRVNPFLQAIWLHVEVAHDDALQLLSLVAEIFNVISSELCLCQVQASPSDGHI